MKIEFGRQITNEEVAKIEELIPISETQDGSDWVSLYDLPGVGRVATGGDYGGAWGDYFVVPNGATAGDVLKQVQLDWQE